MKKCLVLIILSIVLQYSQAIAQPTSFETLKLNSSPAFVILGVEPDNIQRPSTPTQFVAGLQNSVVDGKLQPNVAFEISPYYLANPKKDSKRFNPSYYLLDSKGFGPNLLRTLSLSMGTSTTDQQVFGSLKSGTGTGLGLRFMVIDGKPSKSLKRWNDAYIKEVFYAKFAALAGVYAGTFDFNVVMDRAINDLKDNILPAEQFNTFNRGELEKFIADVKKQVTYDLKSQGIETNRSAVVAYLNNLDANATTAESTELQQLNAKINPLAKQGFMLEFAAGQAYVFQDNTFDGLALAKSAIWLTPSIRWDVSNKGEQISLLDAMAVFRYTFNDANVDVTDYLDIGVKSAFTQNKWSGTLEYVYRHASEVQLGQQKKYTYRLTAGFDYKLTDIITFKFNFGSNFDGNTTSYTDPKKVFAIGGLNFGLTGLKK